MSQTVKQLNGDNNANGSLEGVENGNDLNTRKAALTPLEFRVTQQRETERPFSNKYNKFWETGTYHCVVCDEELFKSETKFESKSGWPAFYNVVDPQRVKLTPDLSHVGANLLLLVAKPDLARTEVSCANCNAHLGHLFKDGPKPTGLRYCINSASLHFRSTDGNLINNVSTPVTNGNGNLANGNMSLTNGNSNRSLKNQNCIREYVCNPENTCSRPSSAATTPMTPITIASTPTGTSGRTARENFFSSLETNGSTMPPMGALCLNNQSCQRIPTNISAVPNAKKPAVTQEILSNIISNGAENKVENCNGVFTSTKATCSKGTNNGTGTEYLPSNKTNRNPTTMTSNDTTSTTSATINSTTTTTTPVIPTKTKFQFSKGTSLTAARINFFQKIASKQESSSSPSRWASAFNSRWSSNKSSVNQNAQENYNNSHSINSSPFPSSCSSGSLSAVLKSLSNNQETHLIQPRKSASSFFTNSSSSSIAATTPPIEQVSTPPRAVSLRETTL